MSWTPLLDGTQRERALHVVGAIAAELRARFDSSAVTEPEAWSLAEGRSGVALFFAYTGTGLGDDGAHAFAAQLVEESLEAAAGVAPLHHLFEGFAGVAWTLAHLDGWLLDLSDGDPNDAVDDALLDMVSTTPWPGEYDLLAGLTGIGVYALERVPRPRTMDLLSAVVNRLHELAERDPGHPFWWSAPHQLPADILARFPNGAWNLGAAHGAPGVIALLGKARAAGVGAARPLLDRAAAWLLDQRLPASAGSTFPSFAAPDVVPGRSPVAWCYGDPGAAAALFAAAPDWQTQATAIAEHAAARPMSDSDVAEASFCHGSAGLAHIYNRLHQATGSEVLRTSASRWLGPVMNDWRPGAAPGLLTGAAGIGLVLLAAATPVEPRWDRAFLLS
jgi:lantibiotic modifying enzyme